MIVVTGGAGFVGSNLVHGLARRGASAPLVVDDLTVGGKVANLAGVEIHGYLDRDDFLERFERGAPELGAVTAVLHQGAITDTTDDDGRRMIACNTTYSTRLLEACLVRRVPFIYASSAAVYGRSPTCRELPADEAPVNVYAFSKLLVDNRVRRELSRASSQVVGLRYFNVYGPREAHKGAMASLVLQLDDQLAAGGPARIFGATETCAAGEQQRDYVHVEDVVEVVLWFLDHPDRSGIFNCGTGRARTANDLAAAVVAARGGGEVVHVPFPPTLRGRYQERTEADLTRLRAAGCDHTFRELEVGVAEYVAWRRASGEG